MLVALVMLFLDNLTITVSLMLHAHKWKKRFWKLWYKRIAALLFVEPNAFWFICRFYMIHPQFVHNVMLFYDSRIIFISSYKLYFFSTWFIYSSYMYYWDQTHDLLFHHGFVRRGAKNVAQPHTHDHMSKTMARGLTPCPTPPFFCSAMAEPWAQGARRGATVQGNAWRMAGTGPSSPQPSSAHCRRSAERSLPLLDTTTTWTRMPSQGASTHRFGVIGGNAESAEYPRR
jgi:hypothetical protein